MASARKELNLTGKVCMITGAGSGIGRATAVRLAALGGTLVVVSRDFVRGKGVLEAIARENRDHRPELLLADLSSGTSIRKLAAEFALKHRQLHILINNAG